MARRSLLWLSKKVATSPESSQEGDRPKATNSARPSLSLPRETLELAFTVSPLRHILAIESTAERIRACKDAQATLVRSDVHLSLNTWLSRMVKNHPEYLNMHAAKPLVMKSHLPARHSLTAEGSTSILQTPEQASRATSLSRQCYYRPLDAERNEIRLVGILPHSGDTKDVLRCIMSLFSLDETCPNFEAVSYTWGHSTRSRRILVDNQDFYLPINSEGALRRLALPDRIRLVFLDAVCVDQDNPVERIHQVLLMRSIYSRASSTLVYLGESDETLDRAMNQIKQLAAEMNEDIGSEKNLGSLMGWNTTNFVYSDHHIRSKFDSSSVLAFYHRRWFRRAWVVQEVALAKSSAFICGSTLLDGKTILDVAAWLFLFHKNSIDVDLHVGLRPSYNLWSTREYAQSHRGGLNVCEILEIGRSLEASESRDKIYGMLGLLDQRSLNKPIIPNYAASLPDIIRDAVRQSFGDYRDTPFLVLRGISHRDESDLVATDFASWVPRFDRPDESTSDPVEFSSCTWFKGRPALGDLDLARRSAQKANGNTLNLHGILFASLSVVSIILDSAHSILEWYDHVKELVPDMPIFELHRAVIADNTNTAQQSTPEDIEAVSKLLECYRSFTAIPRIHELTADTEPLLRQVSNAEEAVSNACSDSRFAKASNGYIAVVPKMSQADDVIVMVHGAERPFILRPRGPKYLMLGEAYVDGCMPGQERHEELHQELMMGESVEFEVI